MCEYQFTPRAWRTLTQAPHGRRHARRLLSELVRRGLVRVHQADVGISS